MTKSRKDHIYKTLIELTRPNWQRKVREVKLALGIQGPRGSRGRPTGSQGVTGVGLPAGSQGVKGRHNICPTFYTA